MKESSAYTMIALLFAVMVSSLLLNPNAHSGLATASVTKVCRGVVTISPMLPSAALGEYYELQLKVKSNGCVEPVLFELEYGSLPPGLSLTADGRLFGVLAEEGTFNFIVSVRDENTEFGSKSFTLKVGQKGRN